MGAADDFRALLEPGAIRAVFQPIVRLSDLGTIGYEGLARFPTPPGLASLPPDVMLAAGARYGLREPLELACWSAIAAAGAPPDGGLLWVNLSPESLGHPGLLEIAGRLPSRLVIELTEQDTVLNNALLRERLRPWIARGALVAVDDAGAGFTSLEYVAEIRPDFLKLSRGMVDGIDGDSTRQAVLRATAAFAREVGARIVAEGVERVEELETLRTMDIDYGQGYLFGRPGAAWPSSAPAPCAAASCAQAGVPRLERELARAQGVRGASEAVADHLARRGLLPGVYVLSGGRARCQASRGAWQVYDGLPATVGVVGRVLRTGKLAVIEDVGEAPEFVPGVPGVRAEVCAPLVAGGRVVGVLDVQVLTAVEPAMVVEIERCAALLSERIGAEPPESPAARLSRIVALDDDEAIVRETLAAALGLSGYESGLVALTDDHGALYPHLAEGPFTVAFSDLTAGELASMAKWVDEATSSYTVGDTAGRGFSGHEVLRRAGATSLIVLPLLAAGTRLGLLVVADRANRAPDVESIEFLELLALQAAAGLRAPVAPAPLPGALPERAGVVLVDGGSELAGALRAVVAGGGTAYQTGATEFVLAFAPDNAANAEAVGQELRTKLGVPVGVAVGVIGEPGESVLRRARGSLI